MFIRCSHCNAVYERPPGTLQQINQRYHCARCAHRAFVTHQPGAAGNPNGAMAGAAVGAAVGAAIAGPPGALVGGIIGFITGSNAR